MNNDPFYQGIARLVEKTTRELVTNVRPIDADLAVWQGMAIQWLYERLKSSPRNHAWRTWFIHRSIVQMTGLDALETAVLHLGPKHRSSFLTPERLRADKRLQTSPSSGWQRVWLQERKLQAACAQLVEERGWTGDHREAGLLDRHPLFAGRLLTNDEQRSLVVLAARDTDLATGTIGPIDNRTLALTLHDVRQHGIPCQAGCIVILDPQTLAVRWHETLPDDHLGAELAALREDFWIKHVLADMPLPVPVGGDVPSAPPAPLDDEQLYKLGILVMQHCLSREYRNIAEAEYRECRRTLHDFLQAAAIPHGEYVMAMTTLDYQLARDPIRTRAALEDLQIVLDDFRLPLNHGDIGEFNRGPVLDVIDELKLLDGESSRETLAATVRKLVDIPLELGPINMDKAVGHLLETGLVTAPSLHVERLVTKVTSGTWKQEIRDLKQAMNEFFEDRVKRVMESIPGNKG